MQKKCKSDNFPLHRFNIELTLERASKILMHFQSSNFFSGDSGDNTPKTPQTQHWRGLARHHSEW